MREAAQRFGEAGMREAWSEFHLLAPSERFDEDSPQSPLFLSWFLHDWRPDAAHTDVPKSAHGSTAAQAFLALASARLDPIAYRYVEACCAAPFSFHEVLDCRPGVGFRLRDVLLGTEADVIEHSGSGSVNAGDLLYTKLVSIEGITLVEGMAPMALPPRDKLAIIELRKKLGTQARLFGAETLREFEREVRALYLKIADTVLNPKLPELRNTDGDPLEMHTLVFDLESPDAAFEMLKDLAVGESDDDAAERDSEGKLVRAQITWGKRGNKMHKDWDNTSLGAIRIEGRRLTAEVNSAKRAAALRKLIEQRLGRSAHVKPSIVQSMHSLLSREPTPQEQAKRKQREREHAELAAQPEVQAVMREHLRNHYRAWVDTKLPALNNRTPRKAVRDADGREAVEALIAQIERNGERMKPEMDSEIMREVRETLGLASPH